MLKIFLLERKGDKTSYGEAYEFLIAAENKQGARSIAVAAKGRESKTTWLTGATCKELGTATSGITPGVIIRRAMPPLDD